MKKLLLIVSCLSFTSWFYAPSFADVVDRIIVVVNDQAITNSEIEAAMKPIIQQFSKEEYDAQQIGQKVKEVRKEVIERLIEEKLILQEAKKQKIEVKNSEIEDRLQQIRSKFPDEESFKKALASEGINMWQLRKTYKDQIMIKKMARKYMKEHIQITPTQIADYYQAHLEDFKAPLVVGVSQILIRYKPTEESAKTEKIATQVSELLDAGADFSVVAKKYSEGPNVQEGGDMGMVERGTMSEEIDSVLFSMKESQISKPIKTGIGFVIVKVNYIRPEQIKPLTEVKGQIEELLLDENAKKTIDIWIKDLKEKAFVSIKE